jgi:murein DD-endopeptidase MepM/ murein hydrolase activator NlpD
MEAIGVLILSVGIWVSYCGVYGIPVGPTALAIINDPSNASKIVADAKKAAAVAFASITGDAAGPSDAASTGGLFGIRLNPYAAVPVSDGYGARGGEHKGIDYMLPVGTPLPSVMNGVLHNDYGAGSGGYMATVRQADGWSCIFMHCSKLYDNLNGKNVSAGDIIGLSGGKAGAAGAGDSTGPHLHLQINDPSGTPVNPADWFSGKLDKASLPKNIPNGNLFGLGG